MALLQSLHLEHLPLDYTVHISLYKDLKNASFLHQQLLAGNTEFEYALIDASIIISTTHALAATYRAVNDLLENRLRSRNVHSEIVFSLSPNNNIAESFRRFGISPTTTNLLLIKISTPSAPATPAQIRAHLQEVIQGEQVAFEDAVVRDMTDLARVRKVYKLNGTAGSGVGGGGGGGGGGAGGTKEEEEDVAQRKELEILVLGCMALRGSTN